MLHVACSARVCDCARPAGNEQLELSAEQMRELLALPYVERDWRRRGEPGIRLARNTGNMYTASLYGSLLSFLYACASRIMKNSLIITSMFQIPRIVLYLWLYGTRENQAAQTNRVQYKVYC